MGLLAFFFFPFFHLIKSCFSNLVLNWGLSSGKWKARKECSSYPDSSRELERRQRLRAENSPTFQREAVPAGNKRTEHLVNWSMCSQMRLGKL
jgi:hypothetical protein